MVSRVPRVMLAAAASGSGKTTAVCAVMRALANRGKQIAAFKCGPDYIDPMFHEQSVGVQTSSNLDLFLSSEATVRCLLAENAADSELAIMEGVMGYYDGIACTTEASSYALARATETPVVLILDCKSSAITVAAAAAGICQFRSDANIRGVLFNRLSCARYPEMKALVERECGVKSIGFLPNLLDCSLESRHLGLVTAAEVQNLSQTLDRLAAQAEKTVDLALLERLAKDAPPLSYEESVFATPIGAPVIAVARDKAFCFYYADTLRLLERLGARLRFFSPLTDTEPPTCDGLLLGGGYPELYAEQLSENEPMRRAISRMVADGLPTIAECGGFLYLHRGLEDREKRIWPMTGVFDAKAFSSGRLSHFGYAALTARADGMLCRAGEQLRAHEFHYWESEQPGESFFAQKPSRTAKGWQCAHMGKTLYAGFPHLYFPGNPQLAMRFVKACAGKESLE